MLIFINHKQLLMKIVNFIKYSYLYTMTSHKIILILAISALNFLSFGQSNSIIGLLRTSNPASVRLGSLNVATGSFSQLSSASIATSFNATGAALDPDSGTYFFLNSGGILSVDIDSGSVISQIPLSNPIAPSNFDNFRFNTSNAKLYGLARRYIQGNGPGQGYGELFLATINPITGVISQISPQSVGESFALQGNAIDPQMMVYYYSDASELIGLDMYTGLVYSSPTITFPQGGVFFDNFTYNCTDTTIYGLIRTSTSLPQILHFGKIDPQTGVVTRISQQPLVYNLFTINGSSTIDQTNGIYYYASVLPQGGNAIIGVSIVTGDVVSVNPIPSNAGVQSFFDLIRHPSDCSNPKLLRLDPNGGTAELANEELSQLNVYPNPFTDQLTITAATNIDTYVLRDVQGKIVLQENPMNSSLKIETANLENGIYFIEINTANTTKIVKLIK